MATEKIFIQIDHDKIELTGDDKQAFLNQREIDKAAELVKQAEAEAKEVARQAILDRLGLTADELKTILGGN